MNRGPKFVEREIFFDLLEEVRREDGQTYGDPNTVYGDLSRLVVSWLAHTDPATLERVYERGGFKPNANIKPLCRAARRWFERHHPEHARW